MLTAIVDDYAAFDACALQDRKWYNKLFVAQYLGYECGTVAIPRDGTWIVRPITNLDGMGVDATISWFPAGTPVAPDFFWGEVFTGRHITIDYERVNGMLHQTHTFEGFNTPDNLIEFTRWVRVDYPVPPLPAFDSIAVDCVNIEMIGGNIIEVHFRPNSDPVQHDEFWPIWSDDQQPPPGDWVRIPDAVTHIGRKGFYVPAK